MSNDNYEYPFRENAKGTGISDIYVTRGDEIEKYIFDNYALPHVIEKEAKEVLIDIGAGEGRYSKYFGVGFSKVIAVEPDKLRYQRTKSNLEDLNTEVQCIHGTARDVPPTQKADVVINIHVLQHIHPDDASEIIDGAAKWLNAGGLFVLAFTKKTPKDNDWNVVRKKDGTSKYESVTKEEFMEVASNYPKDTLPVHKIRYEELNAELKRKNFLIKESQEYAPRFLGERNTMKGKFFMFLYRNLSAKTFHTLVKYTKYPLLEDVVVVAEKQ